jgi:hypothetical protein
VRSRRRALETLEDAIVVFGRHPDAVIAHLEPSVDLTTRDADLDRVTGAVLDGVRNEIRHDLLDAQPIPLAHHFRGFRDIDRAPGGFERRAEPADHFTHQLGEIELTRLNLEPTARES